MRSEYFTLCPTPSAGLSEKKEADMDSAAMPETFTELLAPNRTKIGLGKGKKFWSNFGFIVTHSGFLVTL